MTRWGVISALVRAGMYSGSWELDDAEYDPVSVRFVRDAWYVWVESLPPELKQRSEISPGVFKTFPRWIPDVFDCNHIASDFAQFLDRCLAVDAVKTGKKRGAFEGGRFDFLLNGDATKGHSRNWFVDYGGVAHRFDAGNDTLDTESDAEKQTISYGETA